MNVDFHKILTEIQAEIKEIVPEGESANYIPELAKVKDDSFGIHLYDLDGSHCGVGDDGLKFSIQSITKVLTLALALKIKGDAIWERVDVEPSGDPFNSLVQLEHEKGIPRNPLINSGAIVICDILYSALKNPKRDFLDFVNGICDLDLLKYNEIVAESEKLTGHRNAALANLLKSFGNIENDIDEVLDFYYHTCAIEMTCEELARTFLLFANDGKVPSTGEQTLTLSQSKRINAIMQTCGFYDEAGEFSFRVGLPGKSGVGGGIVAVHPDHYSVAVWSPKLNPKGNSELGMKSLELLTTKSELSIF